MKEIRMLNSDLVALIDDEDEDLVGWYQWRSAKAGKTHYAHGYRNDLPERFRRILMHRLIMDPPDEIDVDHIDRNAMNNQKSNLRLVTASENAWWATPHNDSTSKFKGVYLYRKTGKWRCQIRMDKSVNLDLGNFVNEHEAAFAYDVAARQLFGRFAYLNGVDEKIPDDTQRIIMEGVARRIEARRQKIIVESL